MTNSISTSWRILDFSDAKVELSTERGRLVVRSRETDKETSIPWDEINIILCGLSAHYTGGVLHQAAKYDVVVLFTDWRSIPVGGVYPWLNTHNRIAARQNAQASLSEPRRKNAWMQIVKAKIIGQANVLKKSGDDSGARFLSNLAKSVRTGDESNTEGQAARYYWGRVFSTRRGSAENWHRDQDSDDIKNSLLNYTYTILRGHSIRAICMAGLAPTLGLFHHNRANFFSLADDLIEPFRPAVDEVVDVLDIEQELNRDNKAKMVDVCNRKFLENGLTIPSVMNDLAQQLGRYVEGEVQTLEVPTWTLGDKL